MKPILEVKGLVKHFPIRGAKGVVQAVNNISFSIAPGETLGLVGESGSGKTTVGRSIVGLGGQITAGSILLDGRDITNPRTRSDMRGEFQMVFQESAEALDPRYRIGESIEEPLLALGMKSVERQKRVRTMLDLVELSAAVIDRKPAELSGGQLQRVGIARALATKPKLLVLDEPTSALDPSARASIIELLRSLQGEIKTACLFISHDLSTVRYVSQQIAVMYLGMIVEKGPTRSIFARPRHPYTVGLLSSVLLPDPVDRGGPKFSLAGEIPSPINLPEGCFLAGRCRLAEDACRNAVPVGENVSAEHVVHCRRWDKVEELGDFVDGFDRFEQDSLARLRVGLPA